MSLFVNLYLIIIAESTIAGICIITVVCRLRAVLKMNACIWS